MVGKKIVRWKLSNHCDEDDDDDNDNHQACLLVKKKQQNKSMAKNQIQKNHSMTDRKKNIWTAHIYSFRIYTFHKLISNVY